MVNMEEVAYLNQEKEGSIRFDRSRPQSTWFPSWTSIKLENMQIV